MATKKKVKSTKPDSGGRKVKLIDVVEDIKDVDMLEFARKNYYEYGTAVLEDRAIPDYADGMNPVNRRALWSCFDMGIRSNGRLVKSARVVGDTMGRFHPHGDASLYTAVVGMSRTFSPVALIDSAGNWGSLSDTRSAAMRYTEMRLSKFSDNVLFNKFYMPVVEMAPNYDGSLMEPVRLPALLPIVLLNGREGIAPGARTYIPTFEQDSVVKLLKLIYEGEEINSKLLYKTLKFKSVFGGTEEKPETEEAKLERLSVFKNRVGKVVLRSTSSWDEKNRTLTVTKFARVPKMETLLWKLLDIEGIQEARDDSVKSDRYGTVVVILKRGLLPKKQTAILNHIKNKLLSSNENYILNFTDRYRDEEGNAKARMKPMSLTVMVKNWIQWRVDLERKACEYWIGEAEKQILKLELLMLAVDNRKLIIESLDKDCTQEELELWLAKKLKISQADAAFIYDLKVRQLRKLEKKELIEQRKAVISKRNELKTRKKTPLPFMAEQLKEFKFEELKGHG